MKEMCKSETRLLGKVAVSFMCKSRWHWHIQYCVSQHHDKNIPILVLNCHYYITKITKVNEVQHRSPQGANIAIVLWLLASAALISKHALSSHHMCCRLSQCYVLSYFFACLLLSKPTVACTPLYLCFTCHWIEVRVYRVLCICKWCFHFEVFFVAP